jgi:hypothetical protein
MYRVIRDDGKILFESFAFTPAMRRLLEETNGESVTWYDAVDPQDVIMFANKFGDIYKLQRV